VQRKWVNGIEKNGKKHIEKRQYGNKYIRNEGSRKNGSRRKRKISRIG
jgi:hypothetical protein